MTDYREECEHLRLKVTALDGEVEEKEGARAWLTEKAKELQALLKEKDQAVKAQESIKLIALAENKHLRNHLKEKDGELKEYRNAVGRQVKEIERLRQIADNWRDAAKMFLDERDSLKQKVEDREKEFEIERGELLADLLHEQGESTKLRATLGKIREAAEYVEKWHITYHDCSNYDCVFKSLKQACTKGEKWTLKDADLDDSGFDKPEKKVCPDCGGSGWKGKILDGYAIKSLDELSPLCKDRNEFIEDCPTCKDGTGEVDDAPK